MKKYTVWLIALCLMVQLVLPLGTAAASAQFNITSLVNIAKYMTGQGSLTPEQMQAYDLDGNGSINVVDLVRMALIVVGGSTPNPPNDQIDDQRAMELALAEVPGAQPSDVTEFKRDLENGNIVYDVTIIYGGFEYEFEISAVDGSFRSWSQDKLTITGGTGDIGLADAQTLALARIPGATASNVVSFRPDYEDTVRVYDGEIIYNGRKYECEIVAATGEFVHWSWELTAQAAPNPTPDITAPPTAVPSASVAPTSAPTATTPPAPSGLTEQQARELVLSWVPGATNANFREFHRDTKFGQATYEGELVYNGITYDFEINAQTGEQYEWGWEMRPQAGDPGVDIGVAAVRSLVLERVPGATEANIIKIERDYDDGIVIYEGELRYDGREYDFEVVAATGVICKWNMEVLTVSVPAQTAAPTPTTAPVPSDAPAPTSSSSVISRERAQEIAVAQVPGATTSNVTKCELDWEHGRRVYEIEIVYGNREYEFDIDAYSGAILDQSSEVNHRPQPTASAAAGISRQEAQQLVLNRVPGATTAHFTDFELERDHGVLIYEGELKYNGMEYEFEIRASDGAFLKWEVDRDD